jgi:hypothetical protein
MATVLTYWCLPEEEPRLLDYLDRWEIYAYPPDAFPNKADATPIPIRKLIKEQNPSQLDFGLKQFLSEKDIGTRNQPKGGSAYGVGLMQSHTIGYSRPCYRIGGECGCDGIY